MGSRRARLAAPPPRRRKTARCAVPPLAAGSSRSPRSSFSAGSALAAATSLHARAARASARCPEQPRPARPAHQQAHTGRASGGRACRPDRDNAHRDLDSRTTVINTVSPRRPPHPPWRRGPRRRPGSALRRRRRRGRQRLDHEQDTDRDAARGRRWRDVRRAAVPVEDGIDPCPRPRRRPRSARSRLCVGDRRSLDVPRTRAASPRGRPALTDRHGEQPRCFLDAAWPKHHDDRLRVRVRLGWSVRLRRELAGGHQRGLDQTRVDPSRAGRHLRAAVRSGSLPGRRWSLPEPEPSGSSPAVSRKSNSSSRWSPRRGEFSPRSRCPRWRRRPLSPSAPAPFG